MELYVITSLHSKKPLAEIRTDGKNIDWIVDNTNGKLKSAAQGDFLRLKLMVDKSSHLDMKPPTEATVGILRYSLENGDVIEITTDGKSALLNGKMMPEEEKFGLMSAIASGKIKVKSKADIERPMQLIPRPKPSKKAPPDDSDDGMTKAIKRNRDKEENNKIEGNAHKDREIDAIDFEGTECPKMGQQLLYLLKYGDTHA